MQPNVIPYNYAPMMGIPPPPNLNAMTPYQLYLNRNDVQYPNII